MWASAHAELCCEFKLRRSGRTAPSEPETPPHQTSGEFRCALREQGFSSCVLAPSCVADNVSFSFYFAALFEFCFSWCTFDHISVLVIDSLPYCSRDWLLYSICLRDCTKETWIQLNGLRTDQWIAFSSQELFYFETLLSLYQGPLEQLFKISFRRLWGLSPQLLTGLAATLWLASKW